MKEARVGGKEGGAWATAGVYNRPECHEQGPMLYLCLSPDNVHRLPVRLHHHRLRRREPFPVRHLLAPSPESHPQLPEPPG